MEKKRVASSTTEYAVGELVAEINQNRVYRCEEVPTGRQVLLRIAAGIADNGGLDREAYILRELKRLSDVVEVAYTKATNNPDRRLHYDRLFPEVVDSFVSQEQGKRRINILAFRDVEAVSGLLPLSHLATKDRLRVDLRSSAWIMGRLLKLLGFVHNEGIAVQAVSRTNILLQPEQHYAILFDWSLARTYSGEVPSKLRTRDISRAALAVLGALGLDPEKRTIPDVDDTSRHYVDYLLRLADLREADAERAHRQFYDIVNGLWKREYYPFTTYPLD